MVSQQVGWFVGKILVSILKVQGSTFINDVVEINCDLLINFFIYSCSFSMSFFFVFLDATPPQHCSCSSTSFLFLVLNAIPPPTPFQHWLMFFFDTTLAHVPRHSPTPFYRSSCSSLILFLLLFNVTFIFVPQQWSYSSTLLLSSLTLLLLLFNAIHVPPIAPFLCHSCSSYFKDLSTPHFPNWYSPPPPLHVFVSMGKTNFPNSTFILQTKLEGEYFFFPNVCLLVTFVPCFDCPCFFLVNGFFVCCVQELFGHCTFHFTHCISFCTFAFCIFLGHYIFSQILNFFGKYLSWFSQHRQV